jgi:predicted HTH transcriptional regulator
VAIYASISSGLDMMSLIEFDPLKSANAFKRQRIRVIDNRSLSEEEKQYPELAKQIKAASKQEKAATAVLAASEGDATTLSDRTKAQNQWDAASSASNETDTGIGYMLQGVQQRSKAMDKYVKAMRVFMDHSTVNLPDTSEAQMNIFNGLARFVEVMQRDGKSYGTIWTHVT